MEEERENGIERVDVIKLQSHKNVREKKKKIEMEEREEKGKETQKQKQTKDDFSGHEHESGTTQRRENQTGNVWSDIKLISDV